MSVQLDLTDSVHICPYCDSILSEEDRHDERLHQFDQTEDAVPVIDLTLKCPECRIRIHKRTRAR